MSDPAQWRAVGTLLRERDPQCRGILVLGLDSHDKGLQEAFAASASEPLVKGFAVGRFIFWAIAEAWFAGRLTDAEAISQLADRYLRVRALWSESRSNRG
jgi:5-dehydro-2-deoxygluconokinase